MTSTNGKVSLLFSICDYFDRAGLPGLPYLKYVLRIICFRSGWYSNDHAELDQIFQAMRDPWNLESSSYDYERMRLLSREVVQNPHETILEVGCAEGVF